MAITKNWLKKVANAKSFSKGEDYYDAVDDLTKIGNVYSAVVYGSEEYEVTITDFPTSDPSAYCDCPYDHDGICKHIVAVSLNIVDGNFEEEEAMIVTTSDIFDAKKEDENTDDTIKYAQLSAQTFYDDFFLKQDVVTRMSFLRQLFANDEKLRKQFYAFSTPKIVQNKETQHSDSIGANKAKTDSKLIEKTTENVLKKLNKLADADADDCYSGSGRYDYDEEGEGVEDWFYEKLDKVFTPYLILLSTQTSGGDLVSTTEVLIGMYEACLQVEFKGDLEDYMGDDFEGVAASKVDELIVKIIDVIETTIFNENQIIDTTNLILRRWEKRKNAVDCLSFFEDYLISLVKNKSIASGIFETLKKQKWDVDLIYLTLYIMDISDDDATWISYAEKVEKENQNVMQRLLDRYYVSGRIVEFHAKAKNFYVIYAENNVIDYLKPKLIQQYDESLYVKVHLKSALQKGNLQDYLTVLPLLSVVEIDDFLNDCSKDKPNLYVQILQNKGDLQGVLAFIKQKIVTTNSYYSSYYGSYGFDINQALDMIIETYPKDVFDIVLSMVNTSVSNMKMDRNGYASALKHLKPLKNIPNSHINLVHELVLTLQNKFAGRPAFLDELRQIGIRKK
jgi:SWIM zinc finger